MSRTNPDTTVEIACLDLEGVLVPEIWINVAQKTGIDALLATLGFQLAVAMNHSVRIARRVNEHLPPTKNWLSA